MTDSELLHHLLYRALIEIREQGQDQSNKVVFHLADLFHCVVPQMGRASAGDSTHAEVLEMLRERARERGLDRWVDARTTEYLSRQDEPPV